VKGKESRQPPPFNRRYLYFIKLSTTHAASKTVYILGFNWFYPK
jgi:hypothetical protein